ncbi:MAG: hypothetical protein E6I71_02985 [Chloroflexi bacterium]|nr:MAG: hypothetical protein E6I71_02985 [Chloroflexota bacterium]
MGSRVPTRFGARTNLGLLLLLLGAFLTGWLAFAYATAPARWSLVVHATSGIAILLLLPWKSMIARRGMSRNRPHRWASILLGLLVITSLLAGLAHSTGLLVYAGPFSAMEVHVGAALAAVPFVVWRVADWRLRIGDRALSYEELAAFDDRVVATLDCTGGFYSTQVWSGARLDRLVKDMRGASIRVVSHSGYDRRFPIDQAVSLLLATRFGDQPLDAGHGFPARLVAPGRRGFWWVKWVTAIEVDDLPYWWQSPFPTQ